MIETPVAFFIFKRPALTRTAFNAIRQVKPKTLLIVADGPRSREEKLSCDEARDIINDIDWDCELKTNFADTNLGCRNRVASGLDWVFSQVEEAIILEDDCLPAPDFFSFCEEMLKHYRHDDRVMMVDGSRIDDGIPKEHSYYFSKYAGIWGWASWKRAWKCYDVSMKNWPGVRNSLEFRALFDDVYEQLFWRDIFDKTFDGKIDTWDYQLIYALMLNKGLSVTPNVNLVQNIGFGQGATHTTSPTPLANLPMGVMREIKHPPNVVSNQESDRYVFDHYYGGNRLRYSLKGKLQAWFLRKNKACKSRD